MSALSFDSGVDATPIVPLTADSLPAWRETASPAQTNWVDSLDFSARPGESCLIADSEGGLASVLVGTSDDPDRFALSALVGSLPEGNYRLAGDWSGPQEERAALGWALAAYRFERYKKRDGQVPTLVVSERCERGRLEAAVAAHYQVRDLINTPTEDPGSG